MTGLLAHLIIEFILLYMSLEWVLEYLDKHSGLIPYFNAYTKRNTTIESTYKIFRITPNLCFHPRTWFHIKPQIPNNHPFLNSAILSNMMFTMNYNHHIFLYMLISIKKLIIITISYIIIHIHIHQWIYQQFCKQPDTFSYSNMTKTTDKKCFSQKWSIK